MQDTTNLQGESDEKQLDMLAAVEATTADPVAEAEAKRVEAEKAATAEAEKVAAAVPPPPVVPRYMTEPRVTEQYLLARLFGGHNKDIPLGGTVKIEEMPIYKPFADTGALEALIEMSVLERTSDGLVCRGIKWDEYVNVNGQYPRPDAVAAVP